MRGFTIRKIPAELSFFDDIRALRRNTFIIVSKGAESRPVVEPGVGDDIHNVGGVFQAVQLVERQKTGAGEIRFLAEHAVEFNGMPDRFVNLQSQLAAAKDERPEFLRALGRGMKRGSLFRGDRRVSHQIERFNEFIALQCMLPAKTVGIGSLLNFLSLKRCRDDAGAGNHFALVNA